MTVNHAVCKSTAFPVVISSILLATTSCVMVPMVESMLEEDPQ